MGEHRHTLVGVIITLLALMTLVEANRHPFLHVTQLGLERDYTILGGIVELFHRGNTLLGTIVFVFSFLFPFIKLVQLLTAAGALPGL